MNWLQHKRPIIRKLLKFALDLQGMSLNTVFEKKLLLHVKYTIYDRFDCAQHRLRSNCVQPNTFVQERSIRKVCLRTQICACVWVSLSFSLPPHFLSLLTIHVWCTTCYIHVQYRFSRANACLRLLSNLSAAYIDTRVSASNNVCLCAHAVHWY